MAGYYIPSNYAKNYVNNKKTNEGTYEYDTALNRAGINAQTSLQQLTKQFNVTLNNAYAQFLSSNKGLKNTAIATGYKNAYKQNIQNSLIAELENTQASVDQTKTSIFESLANNVDYIQELQNTEVNNMRRMASSLETYHNYLGTLTLGDGSYVNNMNFKVGDEWTFEDNYDAMFNTQKGIISQYFDENGNSGLSWEDWLRQNSGDSDDDTAWLDWVYNGGSDQFKDFIKNGTKSL